MDFKQATDILLEYGVTLPEIAEALGIAAQTARQARLDPSTEGFRRPPAEWREALAVLAEEKSQRAAADLEGLVFLLRAPDVPDFDFEHEGRRFHASCAAGTGLHQPPTWSVTVDGKPSSISFRGRYDDERAEVQERIIRLWEASPRLT
ncbi:MAG: hypothetical protein R3E10_02680 [Gemmatimonadota bacterium]